MGAKTEFDSEFDYKSFWKREEEVDAAKRQYENEKKRKKLKRIIKKSKSGVIMPKNLEKEIDEAAKATKKASKAVKKAQKEVNDVKKAARPKRKRKSPTKSRKPRSKSKRKNISPTSITRNLKDQGAERVSKKAAKAIQNVTAAIAEDIAAKSIKLAKHRGAKTVQEKDVKAALK